MRESMKKILITLFVFASLLSFSATFSLSVLTLTTIGVDDGSVDVFPLFYATYQPFDFLSFRVNDYLTLSHSSTWNLGPYSIAQPRYYYVEGKFKLAGTNVKVDVLKARMKATQMEKLDGLRLGGLNFDYYGVGGYIDSTIFDLGAAYDINSNVYAAYASASLLGTTMAGYYETKYNQVSLDVYEKISLGKLSLESWGAIGAKTSDLLHFSYLVGGKAGYGNFDLSAQFLQLGANKYDASFQTGDPNSVASVANGWAAYADLNYNINGYKLGAFLRYNSVWNASNMLPLYGLKVGYKDFELKIGNGDLISNLSGEQKIAMELNYYYSMDFGKLINFNAPAAKQVSTTQTQQVSTTGYASLMDVLLSEEGTVYTVKGTVTSSKDLLGKGSFYIQDEAAGLMIYAPSYTDSVSIGEVVEVTGSTKLWNGMIELVATQVKKLGTGQPTADVLMSLSKTTLGSLVYVEGTVKSKGNFDFIVDTGDFSVKVYLTKGTNINISNISNGTKVKVTGILSLYNGEYEILPRSQDDIVIIE